MGYVWVSILSGSLPGVFDTLFPQRRSGLMVSSLLFGLIAAIAWGIHDVCVRFISQRAVILPTLLTVLIAGACLTGPFVLILGDWSAMTGKAYMLAICAGMTFAMACFALYKAFEIGPVRLVSPLIAAYPILSVAFASFAGKAVMLGEWLAVILIIGGVAIVARNSSTSDSEETQSGSERRHAILWSILAGVSFGVTFAVGQSAAATGAELPVIMVTRLTAILCVLAALIAQHGINRPDLRLSRHQMLVYVMGGLDAIALGAVTVSGSMPNPEYAAVTSSIFGMVTIILAWLLLKEKMTPTQWGGVIIVFTGIAYLGL